MIDEQDMLYVKFGRWEETSSVFDLHSIGVDGWLKQIRDLITPIDFRTPSLVDRVAGYMASQGFNEHGELLRKAVAVFLEKAAEFGEKAIAETADFNDLRMKLKPQKPLRIELDRVYRIMYYASDMSAYFRSNDSYFNQAVKALEIIDGLTVANAALVASTRQVINRTDLIKQLGCSNSTLNKRKDFPKPISTNQKPQLFYIDDINAYLKSRGEPLLDVE